MTFIVLGSTIQLKEKSIFLSDSIGWTPTSRIELARASLKILLCIVSVLPPYIVHRPVMALLFWGMSEEEGKRMFLQIPTSSRFLIGEIFRNQLGTHHAQLQLLLTDCIWSSLAVARPWFSGKRSSRDYVSFVADPFGLRCVQACSAWILKLSTCKACFPI